MSDKDNEDTKPTQPTPEEVARQREEEELKRRIEELRKRDPFVYR